MPGVRPGGGGVVFWDGQLVRRRPAGRGAGPHGGRARRPGADRRDGRPRSTAPRCTSTVDDGEALTLRAGVVVNAAGVWAQRLAPGIRLVPSRGSHLVVRGDRLGSPSAALTVPLPGSRSRYVFALPQADGLVYLGLTDEPVDGAGARRRRGAVATPRCSSCWTR